MFKNIIHVLRKAHSDFCPKSTSNQVAVPGARYILSGPKDQWPASPTPVPLLYVSPHIRGFPISALHLHASNRRSVAMAIIALTAPVPVRPLEKKKKRRNRKKRSANKDSAPTSIPQLPVPLPRPTLPHTPAPPPHVLSLSPRKQTLLRHKKSDASVDEPLFVSEVKQLKKTRKPAGRLPGLGAEDEKYSQLLAGQTMADKATIFRAPSARISVYHEQVGDLAPAASGTLLGHGEFTVFQLHNGAITYLACGSSFVYPLLPKLKILRINRTHFILPLVNPQRYWKIDVDTGSDDDVALAELERVLKGAVNYTTLYVEPESPHAGHAESGPGTAQGAPNQYNPFFNAIPESPPSAPVSPRQLNLYEPQPRFLPSPARTPRMLSPPPLELAGETVNRMLPTNGRVAPQVTPQQQFLLGLPTFSPTPQKQAQPIPVSRLPASKAHANPYKCASHSSDSSSMDSLLDEYEENVSITRSINFNASRPPSQSASLMSAPHPAAVQYTRGRELLLPERSTTGSSYAGRRNDDLLDDGFPTTSLSQYNRQRASQSGRSRQSSVSELYTSVSNWMEPGAGAPQLTHSRSNYTLGSRQGSLRPVNIKDTYRDIYRSITLHDIAGILSGQEKPQDPRQYSKLLVTDQFSRRPTAVQRPVPKAEPSTNRLSSSEVFQLLSQREDKVERPSGIGRFFGW